jgi:flagellar basal body-associated protein FliL
MVQWLKQQQKTEQITKGKRTLYITTLLVVVMVTVVLAVVGVVVTIMAESVNMSRPSQQQLGP